MTGASMNLSSACVAAAASGGALMPNPGDAVLSLLSLKNAAAAPAPSPSPAPQKAQMALADPSGHKENRHPNHMDATQMAVEPSVGMQTVLMHCSPQKHRLLLGRLQASGSAGMSSRVGARPPSHVNQLQPSPPHSAALQAALDAHHKSQQQGSVRRPSVHASIAPTLVPQSSPHRRTIRPTPVPDHSTPTSRPQHDAQAISSPALTDATTASSSSSVGSIDSPQFSVSHAVPMDASTLPTLSDFPPLQPHSADPSHANSASPQPQSQRSTPPLTAAAVPAAAQSACSVHMQRSLSAPAAPAAATDTIVSPYRSKPPLSTSPTSASASAEFLLAEQLLRARSSSSLGSSSSSSGGGGSPSSGFFSAATLANSSMQSSCSAVARSSSSTLDALMSGRSSSSSSSSRLLSGAPAAPARSVSSGTIGMGGSKGRCLNAAATCVALIRSAGGSGSYRSSSGSGSRFTVRVKPLDQIIIKANSITQGRHTRTYEFP